MGYTNFGLSEGADACHSHNPSALTLNLRSITFLSKFPNHRLQEAQGNVFFEFRVDVFQNTKICRENQYEADMEVRKIPDQSVTPVRDS